MPKLIADLHIHSHYSRATSRDLDLEHLSHWAQIKGVQVLATGDIAHPGWLAELQEKLIPAEEGLFRLNDEVADAVAAGVPAACRQPVRFLLGGEVSNIYKKGGKVRKVHHLLFMPTFVTVERLQAALEKIGNIRSDGRPILGLDSHPLLEIVLETDPQGYLIPAHIWTPWFSTLGSKSGFDSVDECFDDLAPHIFALETGLSSDPPMNWRVSSLDRYTLVSNSDAHSPPKVAREATVFHTDYSYPAIFAALKSGDPAHFGGTIEFFPEEGKYHVDGHRKCGVRWEPQETFAHDGICPVCGKTVTIGVLNRVAELADREPGGRPARTHAYQNLIPLPEILAEVFGVGASSKRVQQAYWTMLEKLGPELTILQDLPLAMVADAGGELLAEGIRRMRAGEVTIDAGFDGEYGVIKLFDDSERAASAHQLDLFGEKKTTAATQRKGIYAPTRQIAPSHDVGAQVEASAVDPAPATLHSPQAADEALLGGLNAEQQAAVRCVDAPLLIVAGPGTGKTRTLTHRIAYLLAEHKVAPETILAITFTNKAANEMVERLTALLGHDQTARLTVQTFHAWCASLLRREGHRLGLAADFAILGEEDRRALLKRLNPDWRQSTVEAILTQISSAKNRLLTPGDVDEDSIKGESDPPFAAAYRAYDAELRRNDLVDFDDLLCLAVRLLASDAALLATLQTRYQWISVDEYQDINLAQYRLLRLLTAPKPDRAPNLCAIGDPDQAIYGFRGADRQYFLRFSADFPDAQVLHLQQNYRSSQTILAAAAQVIAENRDAERLQLWTTLLDQTKLLIRAAPTDKAEAEFVVHSIEQMVGGTSLFSLDSGRVGESASGECSFGDFAVLFRTSAQSAALVEAFARSGIPYQTVGQKALAEFKDIREILAYLQVANNPDATFYRQIVLESAPTRRAAQVTEFLASLAEWAVTEPVASLIDRTVDFLSTTLNRAFDDLSRERIGQLRLRAVSYERQLGSFLENIVLQRENDAYDPRADRVALMTLHAAKGLEFPVVFIVGCEETLLPWTLAGRSSDIGEERRLFYVGLTRARRQLILTYARSRVLFGQRVENPVSRFVNDIEMTLKEMARSASRKVDKPVAVRPELAQLTLF